MAATPIGHWIFYVALFIIVLIAMYVLIQTLITQVTFWVLRPSEMAAMDLVGTVTGLGGMTGDVETNFRVYAANVTYFAKQTEKIVCVISRRERTAEAPVIGVLTTFHCFSMPFTPQLYFDPSSELQPNQFEFILEKKFQDPLVVVERS